MGSVNGYACGVWYRLRSRIDRFPTPWYDNNRRKWRHKNEAFWLNLAKYLILYAPQYPKIC